MSGGHFAYVQFRMEDIAVEIDELVEQNDVPGRDDFCNSFPEKIIERFKVAAHTIRRAQEMAQRVDWLVSGDDGEESFMSRWDNEVRSCYNKANQIKNCPIVPQEENLT